MKKENDEDEDDLSAAASDALQKKKLIRDWLAGIGELPEGGGSDQSLADLLRNGLVLCRLASHLCAGAMPGRFLRVRSRIRDIDRLSAFVRGMKQAALLHGEQRLLFPPFSGRQLLGLLTATKAGSRAALWDYLDDLRRLWPRLLRRRPAARLPLDAGARRLPAARSLLPPQKSPTTRRGERQTAASSQAESPSPTAQRLTRDDHYRTVARSRTSHLLRTLSTHRAGCSDDDSDSDSDSDGETDSNADAGRSSPGAAEYECVFGVLRGECRQCGGCSRYVKPATERGGPCGGCGHYPIQHAAKSDGAAALLLDQLLVPFEQLVFRELLGGGRFGTVYRGKWKAAGQVAIKVVRGDDSASDEDFKREAWSLRLLRHPNVLLLIGAAIHAGERYLVTELCQHGSLRRFVERSAVFDPCLFIDLVVGAAQGLNYLHELKLVHCDVKTDNILVRSPPVAVVGDMGSTCLEFSPNTGAGTAQYKAPELLLDDYFEAPVTRAADVYSFAVVLYEVFTWGAPAFPADADLFDMQRRIAAAERPDLPPRSPLSAIDGMPRLVCQAWSQNPEERPKLPALIADLQQIKADYLRAQLPPARDSAARSRSLSFS